jgi:hypothetical protein
VALQHKVKRLIGMIDIEFLPPMLNGSGWQVRTLGLPAPYDEGVAQAIEVHVSSSALADFEESQGLAAPLSFELDTSVVPHLPPAEIEALLTVAASDDNGRAVLLRLTRHLAGLDETTTEEELLALVEYVAGLVERGQAVTT